MDMLPAYTSQGVPPVRRDAAANRERLVAAAEAVFAEHGPNATLDDVAKAAGVGPATLYRRFANKDALVHEVLTGFFGRLVEAAEAAARGPSDRGLETFLRTVGVELAQKSGLSAPKWGELAPEAIVEELRRLSTELLTGAQRAGAVRADVTPDDVTAAIWAVRGVIGSERVDPSHRGAELWRRHLETILRGFGDGDGRSARSTV
ncbi:TetR/AcrR family transcriptional regulator [Mycolicibacterium sp. P1-18]|uniref:TetR/AcrR family transcriptional regulator n=1 Tax=Mycolicibacterium sp. P1-18 TaxID=2024615 RepID=UPI001563E7AE|nr:TetR/AcrR family transcriptional regulator [Mycolicibacterium sp. P1-18]